jgi:thiamine-phosphate pyrophosphorylase
MTAALSAGVRLFQYRNKSGTKRSVYEASLPLARIAREANALFLVNDHADIASAVDADGVHLGQDDLPIEQARKVLGKGKLIGISTHSPEQAREAERSGADYIGFGPIFQTSTKNAGEAQGLQNLSLVKQSVSVPVIAIGGVNQANVGAAIDAGADGVAVISSVLSASDIKQAAEELLRIVRESGVRVSKNRSFPKV